MTDITIGVDVSKDTLDVHVHPDGDHCQFSNDQKGFKAILRWLAARPVVRLVFEATGAYHRAFERAMGEALIKDRTAAKNREKTLTSTLLRRQSRQQLCAIQSHLKEIESAIRAIIKADDGLCRKFAILVSIPGIAERSAFALLIDMPELGELEAQQAAALSGTAPMTRQSGKRTGKAFVSGGRVKVRQALYMPALVATRFNPDMKAKYIELRERGKPPKVAITALMRKLIVLANALIRDDREWSPRLT